MTLSIKWLGIKRWRWVWILLSSLSSRNRGTTETMEMSGGIHSPGPDLGPSGHVDDFTRRNLPPFDQWPELRLDRAEVQYPEYLNAAGELTDRNVEKGFGDPVALIRNGRPRSSQYLADWSNRPAH